MYGIVNCYQCLETWDKNIDPVDNFIIDEIESHERLSVLKVL